MKVLITGASGFGGSHLVDHCLACGDTVWGTVKPGESVENLEHVLDQVTLRVGDLLDQNFFRTILDETRFDIIFHLAGVAFVPFAQRNPVATYNVNVLGTVHLLEAIHSEAPMTRVLLVSSAEVYGDVDQSTMPITEEHPIRPKSVLASSKAAAEIVAQTYIRSFDVPVVIARPFNHTGPRQLPDFVVSNFCQQIAQIEAGRQPVLLCGNLSARRDFCDVRDVVRGYRTLALKGKIGKAYNLSSGKSIAITDLLDKLLALARVNVRVEQSHERMRPVEVPDIYGSAQLIYDEVGWRREISFEKTLKDILNFHRDAIAKRYTKRRFPLTAIYHKK
ncbi:MAG TPA: GDP-mannose 4,6-dehydratase [Planctomycetota bacterium]|nr:GDP-mannose 4,6-dehydratase [Planctomycetota bacterium]